MIKQFCRKLIPSMIILCICLHAQTQILITPQVPPTGLIRKDQLWNIVLVNNNDAPQDIQLQVSMLDIKTGEKVLTGASRLFTIIKGAKQLQLADMSPVQYNYSGSAALTDRSSNGLLPIGNYQLCYTLIEQSDKNTLPAMEECLPVEIAPLSPPQLNAPANSDTVTTLYPIFQWIPPAPLNLFNDLNYELLLVEMNKGQQATDAIQKNTPVYQQGFIKNMFFAYPSSAKALEVGKTYAWQVIVKNGNNYAEKTESWSFTVFNSAKLPGIKASGFPRLQQGTGALYYVFDDQLKFAYTNITSDTLVSMQFYDEKSPAAPAFYKKSLKVSPGDNLIQDNLLNKRTFKEDELYRLEIIDARGIKWSILFRYIKPAQ
jgi:Domain of Unknown Function (DUF928)